MTAAAHKKPASMPHILVVDDDNRIRGLVSRFLQEHGFMTCTAPDTDAAREIMKRLSFDALVVDIMMPGENGLEFTKSLRAGGNNIPVLLLTALGESQDRITGLETGADDYLPKPFEPKELVLRLQSILRRTTPKAEGGGPAAFRIGSWTYRQGEGVLDDGTQAVKLTAVEIRLLEALAGRSGEAVSREELAEICDIDVGERTIDVQVTRLRRKIERDAKNPRFLQTIRGKGYLLRVEPL